MAPVSRIVVLGDSVTWGQGLLPQHKFASLAGQGLGCAALPTFIAHSGAVIGIGRDSVPGAQSNEIPDSYPTIVAQVAAFNDNPSTVDLVMIDGGINDIDVRTILSPLTSFAALGDRTKLHCYFDMKQLLTAVAVRFPNPATKIVVTSYYPILSTDSDPLRIPHLLSVRGVPLPEFLDADPLIRKIISLCLQFWHDSEMWLGRAVTETNAAIAGNRIRFAVPQFTEKNSIFASEAWLWGLNLDLSPQDEVVATRVPACDVFYQGRPDELLACAQCHRASAGHPNVTGAAQFADAIEQALA